MPLSTSMIAHKDVYALAQLTMLVYEYGVSIIPENITPIETFVSELIEGKREKLKNQLRMDVIMDLAKNSPNGRVHKFFSNEKTDLQVGITISDTNKRICVVFRGSESKSDWYYDLSLFKVKLHDDVYVHGGFHKQLHNENMYESVNNELINVLADYPEYEVYVTGHSLGGALSTLYGYELSKTIRNNITVVSFASPRVGNTPFRREFDSRPNLTHYRITHNRDMVTAAPNVNYYHVGVAIALKESKFDVYYTYDYSWYKYSLFRCWSSGDHSMDLYYKCLLKNMW
jgi:predicted lipase